MMVSGEYISMWENGRSRQSLEEPYFKKCFRRKTHKKRYITEYCYLRARYVLTCEKISWKRRYASAKHSDPCIYSDTAKFLEEKAQFVWAQTPVASKSRRLRGRKPSKTGNHAIKNFVDRKFPIFRAFFVFCYLRSRSNEDANDSGAAVHCWFRAAER